MGGGDVLTRLMLGIAQFLIGPFGVAFIVVCVVVAFLGAAAQITRPATGFIAMGFGAAAYSASYFVNQFIG